MNSLAMQFGTAGRVDGRKTSIVASGTIEDSSAADIILDAGGLYELFTCEYNANTGAYRGHRSRLIKAPENDLYGSVASATINESASSNSGVTITMNSDSTISIARSSATYAVRYFVRAVGLNTGVGSSGSGGDGSGSGGNVPIGGQAGDILAKQSSTNYDTEWITPATAVEQDNTRPITSAAVFTEVGNINALLATI